MDPPPTATATATADSVDSFSNTANAKLRLMCSYGGHIVPRPNAKSLCYAGGDTRIVAVDRRTTAATLSELTSFLSRTLYNNRPFLLKYQLPNEDLDSLISVTTDEDLQNMLEEHDRIAGSGRPSRIRLFLFPSKPESLGSVLLDPKAESWFCDALNSTKIMQRGQSADSGLVDGLIGLECGGSSDSFLEAQGESLSNSGDAKHGFELSSVPESMMLETSSSFGSTSSSISMSNLPPIGIHGEDGGVYVQDKKAKMPSPGSIGSDSSVVSTISLPQTAVYQDTVVHVPSIGTRVAVESESMVRDPAYGIQMLKTVQVSSHQASPHLDHMQNQQEVRYIQASAPYIPQYSGGPMPVSSYYPMYYSPPHHQPHNPFQPNQPYPVYLLPVRPPQSYNNTYMQYNLLDPANTAPSRPPVHPHTTVITPGAPDQATKVFRPTTGANPLVHIPPDQNQPVQPLVDLSIVQTPEHSAAAAASTTNANFENEYEDDLAYTPIYKTQPPGPALASQYQTMSKAGALLLSETSKLANADGAKQHPVTSQP